MIKVKVSTSGMDDKDNKTINVHAGFLTVKQGDTESNRSYRERLDTNF